MSLGSRRLHSPPGSFFGSTAMNDEIEKFFARGHDYWLTRFVLLRLLGFVYAIAFLVAVNQLVPLIGATGLTPAHDFLSRVHTHYGSRTGGMLPRANVFLFCGFYLR